MIRWIRYPKHVLDEKLWDLENRIHCFRYGHPKYARWDICGWYMNNIIQLLDAMIENPDLGQPIFEFDENDEPIADENWKNKLRLMRYGFDHYHRVCECLEGLDELKAEYGFIGNNLIDIRKHQKERTEDYKKFMDAWHQKEIRAHESLKTSLDMFSKYFLNLWD